MMPKLQHKQSIRHSSEVSSIGSANEIAYSTGSGSKRGRAQTIWAKLLQNLGAGKKNSFSVSLFAALRHRVSEIDATPQQQLNMTHKLRVAENLFLLIGVVRGPYSYMGSVCAAALNHVKTINLIDTVFAKNAHYETLLSVISEIERLAKQTALSSAHSSHPRQLFIYKLASYDKTVLEKLKNLPQTNTGRNLEMFPKVVKALDLKRHLNLYIELGEVAGKIEPWAKVNIESIELESAEKELLSLVKKLGSKTPAAKKNPQQQSKSPVLLKSSATDPIALSPSPQQSPVIKALFSPNRQVTISVPSSEVGSPSIPPQSFTLQTAEGNSIYSRQESPKKDMSALFDSFLRLPQLNNHPNTTAYGLVGLFAHLAGPAQQCLVKTTIFSAMYSPTDEGTTKLPTMAAFIAEAVPPPLDASTLEFIDGTMINIGGERYRHRPLDFGKTIQTVTDQFTDALIIMERILHEDGSDIVERFIRSAQNQSFTGAIQKLNEIFEKTQPRHRNFLLSPDLRKKETSEEKLAEYLRVYSCRTERRYQYQNGRSAFDTNGRARTDYTASWFNSEIFEQFLINTNASEEAGISSEEISVFLQRLHSQVSLPAFGSTT